MTGEHLYWLAPFFPLAVFVWLATGMSHRKRLPELLAVAAVTGSTVVSGAGLAAASRGARAQLSLPWMTVGGRHFSLALWLDPLSALTATLVSVIALVIFVYAATAMEDDPHSARFFAEFCLFVSAMLTLVLAADLVTLFIAWEFVGLCSYLLIGFWFDRPGVPAAATKAFLTTRLCDLAMLLGVLITIGATGDSRIDAVLIWATNGSVTPTVFVTVALLLFVGAAGKSAQVPFHGWLPDAMLGPAAVSALLHSATMVAAGVFLIARLYPLYLAAGPALAVVAWIGVITSLFGGAMALVQTDLKRTLAYSTMSQLGLMYVGLGAGNLLAGVLLLIGHAVYKSLLFLAAGAIEHAVGSREFDRMGGLAGRMPIIFVVFSLGAAALAGIPVTVAWPPKDPTLSAAWHANNALFAAAVVASFLTALYSTRAHGLVFLGPATRATRPVTVVPAGLVGPLIVLALLLVLGLLVNAALIGHPLARLLGTAFPESIGVAALTLGVTAGGVGAGIMARRTWPRAIVWPLLQPILPALRGELGTVSLYRRIARSGVVVATAAGQFDEAVFDRLGGIVSRSVLRIVRASGRFDEAVFDRMAGTVSSGVLRIVFASGRFDTRWVQDSVRTFGEGLLVVSQRLRRLQTGRIEQYLLTVFVWVVAVVALVVLAGVPQGR